MYQESIEQWIHSNCCFCLDNSFSTMSRICCRIKSGLLLKLLDSSAMISSILSTKGFGKGTFTYSISSPCQNRWIS